MEKQVMISHIFHEHPLFLRKNVSDKSSPNCYRCSEAVANMEMAYICTQQDCGDRVILHKKCGELPNQISHPEHSEHPLNLFYFNKFNDNDDDSCDLCGRYIRKVFGYRCSTCNFNLHIKCAKASAEERKELQHPSHPSHPLTLIRNPPFLFYCDGCGNEGKDTAYICSTCEFLLHKSCASLPSILRIDGHHHTLTLIFSLPKKHREYRYRCDVCSKYCDASRWAYFCGECRYIVHIKCAIDSSATTKPDLSNLNEDGGDVIEFPLHVNDISDKLIRPFVIREKGVDTTSTSTCGDPSFLLEYSLRPLIEGTFIRGRREYYHKHPLSLSFVSEPTHKKDDGDEEKDEDEEEMKMCDACVTPISSPHYQCTAYACTYSIHHICSSLPHTLLYSYSSSNPNSLLLGECKQITNKSHNFTLYKSKGRDAIRGWDCDLCDLPTNGMGYSCGDCGKKLDVKCASLPTTIRHASHTRRHHKPLLLTIISRGDAAWKKLCNGCNRNFFYMNTAYCCSYDGCDFALHMRCALLPFSVTNREWDKHPLLLTSDASLDHPSDFYCELCEEKMHPKNWMYHCRPCDASFHLYCLDTGSGYYMNMKLGGRYEMDGIHHHPLTFTCVTLKKKCDLCHEKEYVYTYLGFECASCYYVLCRNCGVRKLEEKN